MQLKDSIRKIFKNQKKMLIDRLTIDTLEFVDQYSSLSNNEKHRSISKLLEEISIIGIKSSDNRSLSTEGISKISNTSDILDKISHKAKGLHQYTEGRLISLRDVLIILDEKI